MRENEPESARILTRVGELHVQVVGSGPPALLWHSLFVDSGTWTRVRQPLADQRRLVLVDGPCHGASAPTKQRFTLDDCAGAACDVLDRLGVDEPVDWVGNAWGGHVGITFAVASPDRCRSLVTIGTPTRPLTKRERSELAMLLLVYRLVGPVRPLVNKLVDALLGSAGDAYAEELVANAFRRANRRGMGNAIRSVSLNRPDLTGSLASVPAPTLVVTGAHDGMWLPSEARASVQHLPRGTCVIMPGEGHVAPLLHSAPMLVELIADFWREPSAFTHDMPPRQQRTDDERAR